jgi:sugar/nucleoside kinase (ribokinase family)
MSKETIKYLCIGGLREDYFITHQGEVHLGVLGGNAVYAAAGARLWSPSVGIVSRIGSNYPSAWLDRIKEAGIWTGGILILPEDLDTRTFYAYLSEEERVDTNPASHFLRINHPLPKFLIDYHSSTEDMDDRKIFSHLAIRPDDIPELNSIQAAHIAPTHYISHTVLPVRLREMQTGLISLDPSERYMEPGFEDELQFILHRLDVFLPSENEAKAFFLHHEMDTWEMAEAFGEMGCSFVVIKSGAGGQFLWDQSAKKRWHIPAYPANIRDVTGAGDSYCGGFIVGMDQTQDPTEAALRGSVSASITVEGIGPLYPLDAYPGLAQARLDSLRSAMRAI